MIIRIRNSFIYKTLQIIIYKYLEFRYSIKLLNIQLQWRDRNRHNFTRIANNSNELEFPIDKVKVGKYTYGSLCVISYASPDEFLEIGNFCSIAIGVKFILGGEHKLNKISTYPFKRILINKSETETFSKGKIIIEDDVWIGTDALILSGVKLSRGTVVAAGSVVVKSTDPYSIIGGNPAKLIRKRFSDPIIENLIDFDYSSINEEYIKNNIAIFDTEIDDKYLKK